VPDGAQSAILQENIEAIVKLLGNRKEKMHSGWEHPAELTVTCLQVGRDEDTFEDSALAQDFVRDRDVQVTCHALLLVPGKAIIGLVQLDSQEVADKVPHLPLLVNDFKHRG